jgi:hypothetical protein
MLPGLSSFRDPLRARTFVSALLAALVLVITASTWNPLHEWLHPDADEGDHHCAITLFAVGACTDAPPPMVAPAPYLLPVLDDVAIGWPRIVSSFRFSGILEHAPPRRA